MECLQGITATDGTPVESPTGVAVLDALPADEARGLAVTAVEPADILALITSAVPVSGNIPSTARLETLRPVAATAPPPVEGVRGVDATDALPIQASGGISSVAVLPGSAGKALAVTRLTPWSSLLPANRSTLLALEKLAGIVSASASGLLRLDAVGGIRTLAQIEIDALHGFETIEALQGVITTGILTLDVLQGIVETSGTGAATWPPPESDWVGANLWYRDDGGMTPDTTTGYHPIYGRESGLTAPYTHLDSIAGTQLVGLGWQGCPAKVVIGLQGDSTGVLSVKSTGTLDGCTINSTATVQVPDVTPFAVGQTVSGDGIPSSTVVNAVTPTGPGTAGTITMSKSATKSETMTMTIVFLPSQLPSGSRLAFSGLNLILDGIYVVGNIDFQGWSGILLHDTDPSALAGNKVQVKDTAVNGMVVPVPGGGNYKVGVGSSVARQTLAYTGTSKVTANANGAQTLVDGLYLNLKSIPVGLDASGWVALTTVTDAPVGALTQPFTGGTSVFTISPSSHAIPKWGSVTITDGTHTATIQVAAAVSVGDTTILLSQAGAKVGRNYAVGSTVTFASGTKLPLSYSGIDAVNKRLTGIGGLDGQGVADNAQAIQAYLTGVSAGTPATLSATDPVYIDLDLTDAENYIVVEPRADGFVEWETKLGRTFDINHLSDGAGGYVKAATLTLKDGSNNPKILVTARNWGTSPQQIKVAVVVGSPTDPRVKTTGTNYSLDRTITVSQQGGGALSPTTIATAINASGSDPANTLVSATVVDSTGTVALLAATQLAGGVDGVLTLPDVSGLPASNGQLAIQRGFAMEYDSIDVPSKTIHGLRYVYCQSGVGSYLWPDTVELGGPDWTCGPNVPVEVLLPVTPVGASTGLGTITFHQVTGVTRNAMSRYASGGNAFDFDGCTDFMVTRSVGYKHATGQILQSGNQCRNIQVTNFGHWEHPAGVSGAVAAHYDGFDVSNSYNEPGKYQDSVFFVVSKGNGNVLFANSPGLVGGFIYRRSPFGLVEGRGSENAFDLHACDSCGAIDCVWDKTALLGSHDPAHYFRTIASLTDGSTAPFGTVNHGTTAVGAQTLTNGGTLLVASANGWEGSGTLFIRALDGNLYKLTYTRISGNTVQGLAGIVGPSLAVGAGASVQGLSTTNPVNPSPDPNAVLANDGTLTITLTPGMDFPDPTAGHCNLFDDGTIVAGGGGGNTKFSGLLAPGPAPSGGGGLPAETIHPLSKSAALAFCALHPVTKTATLILESLVPQIAVTATGVLRIEAVMGARATGPLRAEALAGRARTAADPFDAAGAVAATALLAASALRGLELVALLPGEDVGSLIRTGALRADELLGVAASGGLTVEAVTRIAAAVPLPITALGRIAAAVGQPVESILTASRAVLERLEALTGVTLTGLLDVDALTRRSVAAKMPAETQGLLTQVIQTADLLLEAEQTLAIPAVIPASALAPLAVTRTVEAEAAAPAASTAALTVEELQREAASVAAALEELRGLAATRPLPASSVLPVAAAAAAVLDGAARLTAASAATVDALRGIEATSVLRIEALGVQVAVTKTGILHIEALEREAVARDVQAEVEGTLSTAATIPAFALRGVPGKAATGPAETVKGVGPTIGAPFPLDLPGGVASATAVTIEAPGGIYAVVLLPLDWITGFTSIAAIAVLPLDIIAGITTDGVIDIDALPTLFGYIDGYVVAEGAVRSTVLPRASGDSQDRRA